MVGAASAVRVLAVLAVVLALSGCSGTPPRQLPPSPAYPDRLASTDHDVAAAFDAIDHAPDPATLAEKVLAAAGTTSAASQWLSAGGPVPAAAVPVNDALAGTLQQFSRELAFLAQQINQQVICTGSTALNAITSAPSMATLRGQAAQLNALPGGYRWGEFLPAPREQSAARMPSGRLVVDRRTGPPGNGELTVRNTGTSDAVVALAQHGATVVSMAVQAGQSWELDGVPDGSYDVYYLTGTDWDDVAHLFGRDCQFHRFATPSVFTSAPVPGGESYTAQTITVATTTAGGDTPDTAAVAPTALPR